MVLTIIALMFLVVIIVVIGVCVRRLSAGGKPETENERVLNDPALSPETIPAGDAKADASAGVPSDDSADDSAGNPADAAAGNSADTAVDLTGLWRYDEITAYEFGTDGTGALVLSENSYPFAYSVQGAILSLDFENEAVEDTAYGYTLEGDCLTLTNQYKQEIFYELYRQEA